MVLVNEDRSDLNDPVVLAEPCRLAVNNCEHDHSQAPELTLITKALMAVLLAGRRADLSCADLQVADLSNVDLFKTNLTWVKADRQTRWPRVFDPSCHMLSNLVELSHERDRCRKAWNRRPVGDDDLRCGFPEMEVPHTGAASLENRLGAADCGCWMRR